MRFNELPLHEEVMKGIKAAGFVDCMPVQERVLPSVLQGGDVMVQSKTGSGKTAVFLVTVLQKFVSARDEARKLPAEEAFKVKLPVALIVCPTRELAVQIEDDAKVLSSGIPEFRIGCFYGGVGYGKQDKQVADGLDLIIGTPGRILDYQHMGKLHFRTIDTFVIDEADRLFDMGFYPDIQKMFRLMVVREQRKTMLFSATLGTKVRNLAWDYMNSPAEIEVQPEEITVKEITQELYHVARDEKFSLFLRLLAKENPMNALIFTNTKAKAVELSKRLNVNGYTTQYLMGDLPQSKRLQVINRMKSGELRFLVATDVAARGLQIDDLELVVNYDIPEDFESYVHRIGRTARAGKSGKAITLACEQFVYGLEAIENYIQMKIPVVWADEETVPFVEDKSAKLRFRDLVDESEYASRPASARSGAQRGTRTRTRSGGQGGPSREGKQNQRNRKSTDRTPNKKGGVAAKRPEDRQQTEGRQPSKSRPKNEPRPTDNRRGGKSYSEIQKMDFEERIAYYKRIYGSEGKPVVSSTGKPSGKSQTTHNARPGGQGDQHRSKTGGSSMDSERHADRNRMPGTRQPAAQHRAKPSSGQGNRRPDEVKIQKPHETHAASGDSLPKQDAKSSPPVDSSKKPGFFTRLFKRKSGDA